MSGSPLTLFSSSCQVNRSKTACGITFSKPVRIELIWKTQRTCVVNSIPFCGKRRKALGNVNASDDSVAEDQTTQNI